MKSLGRKSSIFLVLTSLAYAAHAQNFSQDTFLEILDALSVTENSQLNFGVIETPSSTVTVGVAPNGSVADGFTTATHLDTSSVSEGNYTITGTADNSVSISATDVGNVPGINFTFIAAIFNGGTIAEIISSPLTGATLTGGSGNLDLGAQVTVHNPEFDLVISYE